MYVHIYRSNVSSYVTVCARLTRPVSQREGYIQNIHITQHLKHNFLIIYKVFLILLVTITPGLKSICISASLIDGSKYSIFV